MKLIVSIVHRDDAGNVIDALIREGYRTTRLSTTGGFLREGNAAILIGVEENKVPHALSVIKDHTNEHLQRAPSFFKFMAPQSGEVVVGAATVFVLDLEGLQRF